MEDCRIDQGVGRARQWRGAVRFGCVSVQGLERQSIFYGGELPAAAQAFQVRPPYSDGSICREFL